jgi:hypothetical protein
MGAKANKKKVEEKITRKVLMLYSHSYSKWAGIDFVKKLRSKNKLVNGFKASEIHVEKVEVKSAKDIKAKLALFKGKKMFDVVALAPNHCSPQSDLPNAGYAMFLDTNKAIGLKGIVKMCGEVAQELHICACQAGSYLKDIIPDDNKLSIITGYSADIGGGKEVQKFQLEYIHRGCGKVNSKLNAKRGSKNQLRVLKC